MMTEFTFWVNYPFINSEQSFTNRVVSIHSCYDTELTMRYYCNLTIHMVIGSVGKVHFLRELVQSSVPHFKMN